MQAHKKWILAGYWCLENLGLGLILLAKSSFSLENGSYLLKSKESAFSLKFGKSAYFVGFGLYFKDICLIWTDLEDIWLFLQDISLRLAILAQKNGKSQDLGIFIGAPKG